MAAALSRNLEGLREICLSFSQPNQAVWCGNYFPHDQVKVAAAPGLNPYNYSYLCTLTEPPVKTCPSPTPSKSAHRQISSSPSFSPSERKYIRLESVLTSFAIMSRSTKKSQKPSVPLSKVPSVKELCEQLGFQRASIKDTDTFMDATRAWRRSYKTSKNLPGGDLLRWNDPAVQSELKEMAATFLETGDNSERFWGFSRNWYHPSDIQFPEESER